MIDFINYNWMPTIANHCVDLPESFYVSAGISRLHDVDSMNPDEIKENDVVFVKTDFVHNEQFQKDILPKIKCKFTLVTGISDYSVDHAAEDIIDNELVKYWFCTNPPQITHDKIIPLPIGFEEKERAGGNSDIINKHWANQTAWEDKSNLLYVPYHTLGTNMARDQQVKFLESLDFVHVEKERLPFDEYLYKLGQYKFTICLLGAGYDTHRNYESLLVGSVPIMTSSCVEQIYDFYELPSIFVDDWEKIEWVKLQTDYYKETFPRDRVERFFNVGAHKERIIEYAKS
jgi:hypothetical protein